MGNTVRGRAQWRRLTTGVASGNGVSRHRPGVVSGLRFRYLVMMSLTGIAPRVRMRLNTCAYTHARATDRDASLITPSARQEHRDNQRYARTPVGRRDQEQLSLWCRLQIAKTCSRESSRNSMIHTICPRFPPPPKKSNSTTHQTTHSTPNHSTPGRTGVAWSMR